VPYCLFHIKFKVKNLAGTMRHAKLAWINYYARRKQMLPGDDREGETYELALRNEKLFKFLRVKSYTGE
ncbi:MAG: hypothetical protein ACRYGG_18740, partial [Janthinobacterium lividum]